MNHFLSLPVKLLVCVRSQVCVLLLRGAVTPPPLPPSTGEFTTDNGDCVRPSRLCALFEAGERRATRAHVSVDVTKAKPPGCSGAGLY